MCGNFSTKILGRLQVWFSVWTKALKEVEVVVVVRLFFIISVISAAATAAVAEALKDADDRDAQEEAHQASQFSNELNSILRKIVDALIFKWPHKQFQDNRIWVWALDVLAGSSDLSLEGLLLCVGIRCECWVKWLPEKYTNQSITNGGITFLWFLCKSRKEFQPETVEVNNDFLVLATLIM